MFLCPVCSGAVAEAHRRKHTVYHKYNAQLFTIRITHIFTGVQLSRVCVIKMPPFGKGKLDFYIYREDRMHNISTVCLLCFS